MSPKILFCFLISSILISLGSSIAAGAELPALLTPVDSQRSVQSNTTQPSLPGTVVRQQQMAVDFSILPAPVNRKSSLSSGMSSQSGDKGNIPVSRMSLELFDGKIYELVIDEQRDESPDGSTVTIIGHFVESEGSQIIMVSDGQVLSGNITLPGQEMIQIRSVDNTVHVLREINQRAFPPEKEAKTVIPPEQDSSSPVPGSTAEIQADAVPAGNAAAGDESGSILDVMVVYTPAARSAVSGTAAMHTLIDLAVSETNQGYANSGLNQRINLVHREEVSYTEHGTDVFDTALNDLTSTSDGYMDAVHTLRNDYGADMVSLFIDDHTWCGIAWTMQNESHSFASSAFSVVDYDCATGYYSFGHEMGHNQGAMHDRYTTNADGVFSYSHGYQDPERSFRTIMAYNCPSGGCNRVNYWSNPNISYVSGGTDYGPMGIVSTASDSADMRLSHNNTRDTVANWRPRYVYVNHAATGTETGLSANPFNTLSEGTDLIGKYATGARLYVTPGTYSGIGNYPLTINKPMTIIANGTGVVTVTY